MEPNADRRSREYDAVPVGEIGKQLQIPDLLQAWAD